MRETLSQVHNGHHVQKKNKEEPHGRYTPEPVPLQFLDNCKLYRGKLTQLHWEYFHTQMLVNTHLCQLQTSTKDAPTARVRATGCKAARYYC